MMLNLESIYIAMTKILVVPPTLKDLNTTVLFVSFLAIWIFNYSCISVLGGFDQVRKRFDLLPEATQKKQVRAIQSYIAVSIIFVIASIFA
jgi:hypothetical protein